MKHPALLASLLLIAGAALADPATGLSAIEDLGHINGQALACKQMAVASQAKNLMIKHAPKTRRYGEAFEEATNRAFLKQGETPDNCPAATTFASQLTELGSRLQATLPAAL